MNFQIGDRVKLEAGEVEYEGIVAGNEYYDSEYSVNRLPVRVTLIIRDNLRNRASNWDEKARILKEGRIYEGREASAYRKLY